MWSKKRVQNHFVWWRSSRLSADMLRAPTRWYHPRHTTLGCPSLHSLILSDQISFTRGFKSASKGPCPRSVALWDVHFDWTSTAFFGKQSGDTVPSNTSFLHAFSKRYAVLNAVSAGLADQLFHAIHRKRVLTDNDSPYICSSGQLNILHLLNLTHIFPHHKSDNVEFTSTTDISTSFSKWRATKEDCVRPMIVSWHTSLKTCRPLFSRNCHLKLRTMDHCVKW